MSSTQIAGDPMVEAKAPTGHSIREFRTHAVKLTASVREIVKLAGYNEQTYWSFVPDTRVERHTRPAYSGASIELHNDDLRLFVPVDPADSFQFMLWLHAPVTELRKQGQSLTDICNKLKRGIELWNAKHVRKPKDKKPEQPKPSMPPLPPVPPTVDPKVVVQYLGAALARTSGSDPCGYYREPWVRDNLPIVLSTEYPGVTLPVLKQHVSEAIERLVKVSDQTGLTRLTIAAVTYLKPKAGTFATRIQSRSWEILRLILPQLIELKEGEYLRTSAAELAETYVCLPEDVRPNFAQLVRLGVLEEHPDNRWQLRLGSVEEVACYKSSMYEKGKAAVLRDPATWEALDQFLGYTVQLREKAVAPAAPTQGGSGPVDGPNDKPVDKPDPLAGLGELLGIDFAAALANANTQLATARTNRDEATQLAERVAKLRSELGMNASDPALDIVALEANAAVERIERKIKKLEQAPALADQLRILAEQLAASKDVAKEFLN